MERVMIIGPGGAGKSTLARALGAKLGLPVIHLDVEHWLPGWAEPDDDAWRKRVAELAAADRWILDGNFGGTLGIRLARADTVVFMDFNRYRCLWGALKRLAKYHGTDNRPDLAKGCPEGWDWDFYRWIWNYPKRHRPATLALLAGARGKRIVTLRNDRETRAFLASIHARETVPAAN